MTGDNSSVGSSFSFHPSTRTWARSFSPETLFGHARAATENTGRKFLPEDQQYKAMQAKENTVQRHTRLRLSVPAGACPARKQEMPCSARAEPKGWGEAGQANEVRSLPFAVRGGSQWQTMEAVPTLLKFKVGPRHVEPISFCPGTFVKSDSARR